MSQQAVLYTTLFFIGAIVLSLAAYSIWIKNRHRPATSAGVILLALGTLWLLFVAFEVISTSVAAMDFWARWQYLGMAGLATAFLVFAARFTGKDKWLTRRVLALLAIIPAGSAILAFTNNLHGLMWNPARTMVEGALSLEEVRGPMNWVFIGHSYIVVLVGLWLVFVALYEAFLLEGMTDLLMLSGHEVDGASTGDEALRAIREQPPQLVVSDIIMPGMDGLELLAAVRAEPALAATPFVFVSASVLEAAEPEIASLENVSYLRKPFEIAALLKLVELALESNPSVSD